MDQCISGNAGENSEIASHIANRGKAGMQVAFEQKPYRLTSLHGVEVDVRVDQYRNYVRSITLHDCCIFELVS